MSEWGYISLYLNTGFILDVESPEDIPFESICLFYSPLECLFLTVEFRQILCGEQRVIEPIFITLHHSSSAYLGRAPHLVRVQLVGASEFVLIWLPVDATEKSVARLEAQLPVPLVVSSSAI